MIIHVDMDAFYASVELRERPELAQRPVVVGGTPEGRGVVAAASYAARRFGIHSAMPMAQALKRCPELVVLPVRMAHYAEVSAQIRTIFARYTPLIEPLSLDEAFLDARGSEKLFGASVEIGHRIKDEIRCELDLVASVGVAPNKFLAKVASDLDKPDGFTVVAPDKVQAFLDPLPLTRLWGVGKATDATLRGLGLVTIADLRRQGEAFLLSRFGKSGQHLWQLAHGIDPRPVVPEREAKSISHETTFETDVRDRNVLHDCLLQLTEAVAVRLRAEGRKARTIFLKIRYHDFRTLTRSKTLAQADDTTQALWHAVQQLFAQRLPANLPPVRLLGMGVEGLEEPGLQQPDLFDGAIDETQRKLDDVADRIRARFGAASLRRGGVRHPDHEE